MDLLNNKNMKKGFTIIELLVVIAIIGLLSTLAIVALEDARLKQKCKEGDSKACEELKKSEEESKTGKTEEEPTINLCQKDFDYCNYSCANDLGSNLSDCTERCKIIKTYCDNK